MKTARDYHTATLLRNGKVLVAGGYTGPLGSVVLASTELYDPVTNRWSEAAPMLVPHASHTAALLPDGRVLVASGRSSGGDTTEAETYDPATNAWSSARNLAVARRSPWPGQCCSETVQCSLSATLHRAGTTGLPNSMTRCATAGFPPRGWKSTGFGEQLRLCRTVGPWWRAVR